MVAYRRLDPKDGLRRIVKDLDQRISSQETKPSGSIRISDRLVTIDPVTGVETIFGELPDGTNGFREWVGDVVPPPKPSTPISTAYLGVLSIYWDGLGFLGESRPLDFDRTDVEMASSELGPWFKVGELYGEGTVHVTDPVYGEVRYFRLISYDKPGNVSVISDISSATAVPIVDEQSISDEIGRIDGILVDTQQDVIALEQDLTPLPGKITQLETDLAPIPGKLTQLEADLAPLPGAIDQIELDLAPLPGRLEQVEIDLAPIPGKVAEIDANLAPLPGRLDQLDLDLAPLPGKIDQIEIDLAPLPGRLEQVELDLAPIPGRLSQIDVKLDPLPAKLEQVELDLAPLPGKVSQIEVDLAPLPGQIDQIEIDLAPLPSRITELETDLAPLPGKLNQLEADLAPLPGQIDQLELDLAPIPGQITQLEADYAPLPGLIDEAAASLVTDARLVEGSLSKWPFQAQTIPSGAFAPGAVNGNDIANFSLAVTKLQSNRHQIY
jgi:septal ring factor EnvC (AmiA/AmiB activator)